VVPFSIDFSVLRDQDLVPILNARFVSYVYSRLVVGACHAIEIARSRDASEEDCNELLKDSVDAVVEVDDDVRETMVWYLTRIAKRVVDEQAKPSKGQRKAIANAAVEQGHRCYLCGRTLHYGSRPFGDDSAKNIHEIRKKRAFEIEHIWSQSRGGSRARANLAASCNECNNLKGHLLSFADIAIEQIMTKATSQKSLRSSMNGEARFALLWQQGGCCALCEEAFYDADTEELFLLKKEASQPYHFLNLMAICGRCNNAHKLNGVNLRA